MPSDIFKRALFQAANKPKKTDEGIAQGFDDAEETDDEMMEEVNQRSVKSPEILMNNLRGDIRSVDARYQELADMVGEEAAMETPPEVLAMLQSTLTPPQAPEGIGALPTTPDMAAPEGAGAPPAPPMAPPGGAGIGGMMPPGMQPPPMAPPPMPQGPSAMDQGAGAPAPQGFAYGGMVGDAPPYGGSANMMPAMNQNQMMPAMNQNQMNSPMYGGMMPAPQGFAQGGEVGNPAQGIQQFKGGGFASKAISSAIQNNPAQKIISGKRPAQAASGGGGGFGGVANAVGNMMQPSAEMIAAQQAEAARVAEEQRVAAERKAAEELAQKRQKAFDTPTVTDDKTKRANINMDFLNEFARRFDVGNQSRQLQQSRTQTAPLFSLNNTALGAPSAPPVNQFAMMPPQPGMNQQAAFNTPQQYNFAPRVFANGGVVDIPQAGANYTKGPSYAVDPGNSIPQAGVVYTQGLANAGRNGDNMLAHMNKSQAELLKFMGGAGSKNPKTGLPEYFTEEDVDAVSTPGAAATGTYSPEAVSQARTYMDQFLNQRPTPIPTLEEGIKARQPIYSRLLGGEDQKQMSQARILFDIAQRGLNFAGNVDDQGRPVRGSGVSRFAQSFRTLPTSIGQETKYMDEVERAARLAAFQATEKEIDSTRAANIKLLESQRKSFSDIIKADGGGAFGKSLTGRIANMFSSDLVTKFAKGETSPEQDRQFVTAVTQYTQPVESRDPVTGNIMMRKPELPSHVSLAIQTRNLKPGAMIAGEDAAKPALPTTQVGAIPTTTDMAQRSVADAAGSGEQAAPTTNVPTATEISGGGPKTMWEQTSSFAGPVPRITSAIAKVPGLGDLAPGMQQAVTFVNAAKRDLIKNLQNNPRFPEGERKAIESEIDIGANLLDNPSAVRNRMIAIDDFLFKRQQNEERASKDSSLPVATRQAALQASNELGNFRVTMGVPVRATSIDQVKALPAGTKFIWEGQERIKN
jgi:hypothetical protein